MLLNYKDYEKKVYEWLKSNNKLGGQYKIPRLSNNRDIIDQIKKNMT